MRSLNDLYCSPNVIQEVKSRRMRWVVVHVEHIGRGGVYIMFCWVNLRERDHLEDPGIDGRIILRWILRKWDVGH